MRNKGFEFFSLFYNLSVCLFVYVSKYWRSIRSFCKFGGFCFRLIKILVVTVHVVAVGLVVGRRVGQLGGRVVDTRGHQLVLKVIEPEAVNFSGERQVGRGRQVVQRQGAGYVDTRSGPAAAHGGVSGWRSDGVAHAVGVAHAARHDGQYLGDLGLQVEHFLVLLGHGSWKKSGYSISTILRPSIAIPKKFAASWVIRVWTCDVLPRSIRFDPVSNT